MFFEKGMTPWGVDEASFGLTQDIVSVRNHL